MLALSILMGGCSSPEEESEAVIPFDLLQAFPAQVETWEPDEAVQRYERANLFSLLDSQSEGMLAYGFEQVAVRTYRQASGAEMRVEIWEFASPEDAYGVYMLGREGKTLAIGNLGSGEAGRSLSFWQNRYRVRVEAVSPVPQAELEGFGKLLAAALPKGGQEPALVEGLPPAGLKAQQVIFFHQAISMQTVLWLGADNLLGLGPDTDGVVASYDLGGVPAQLLLVEFPREESAVKALAALKAKPLPNLVVTGQHETKVGAVFGKVDRSTASVLLTKALQ